MRCNKFRENEKQMRAHPLASARERERVRATKNRKEINEMRYDYDGTLAAKTRLSFTYVFVVSYILYEIALITSSLSFLSISHSGPFIQPPTFFSRVSRLVFHYTTTARTELEASVLFIMTRHGMHCKISSFSKFCSLFSLSPTLLLLLGLLTLTEWTPWIVHIHANVIIRLQVLCFLLVVLFFSVSVEINFSTMST